LGTTLKEVAVDNDSGKDYERKFSILLATKKTKDSFKGEKGQMGGGEKPNIDRRRSESAEKTSQLGGKGGALLKE